MPRAPRRRPATEDEQVSAGRRHLAAIDPAVMRRVVGRPDARSAAAAEVARSAAVPSYRRGA